jgi:hypothetical protein
MDLREALKEQYHAGLGMLQACIRQCPDDLWLAGEQPRSFWRIAWHAAYFTHNYLVQDEDAFNASAPDWPDAARSALGVGDSQLAVAVEPYELPEDAPALMRGDAYDYTAYVRGVVDATVDALDLARDDTGFRWYPNMAKLSHQLMNLRHLQGHVGQLSELLMARGIDIDWIAKDGTASP